MRRGRVVEFDHSALRFRIALLVLVGLQSSEVRLAHPLMLRQALKLLQHLCVHPAVSARSETNVPEHAELQDWKSLLQTRTLWLPVSQADLGSRMID
jgi:ATP sulfurylase